MGLYRTNVHVNPSIEKVVQYTHALWKPHDPMNRVMLVDVVATLVIIAPANETNILGQEIGVTVQDNPAGGRRDIGNGFW